MIDQIIHLLIITYVRGFWKITRVTKWSRFAASKERVQPISPECARFVQKIWFSIRLTGKYIIDILTLSETHIRSTGKVSVMKMLRVIHFLSLKCKTDSWGGFGLYASNQYDFKRREDLKNANLGSIWIEIFPKKSKSFSVCSNY